MSFGMGSVFYRIELKDDGFTSGIKNAENQMEQLDKNAGGFANTLKTTVIGGIAAFGAALVGATAVGIASIANLESSLQKLQSQTGASKEEMAGMEESLMNIYDSGLGESFDDIAQSMANIKQATGLTGQELEKATKHALTLSETFGLDVAESTNTVNGLMQQFGITSDQAYNLLAQGAQNGLNKNGDMLDVLSEYGVQFASIGFSADEFANILVSGAESGAFSIDKAGDAIKEFQIRTIDGSKTTVDAFTSLGFNADEMAQKFAAGGETGKQAFTQVMTALDGIKDPVEKNRVGVELFGTQWEDLGSKGISALANINGGIDSTKNTLGEIDVSRISTISETFQIVGRNISTSFIEPMKQQLLPVVRDVAQTIIDNLPQIKDTFEKVFGAIASTIKFFADNANIIIPIISGVVAGFVAFKAISGVIQLFNTLKTVWMGLSLAFSMSPLGLVALAIGVLVAAGVALWQNWDTVKAVALSVWEAIKSGVSTAVDFLVGLFLNFTPLGLIIKHWDTIKQVFQVGAMFIQEIFNVAVEFITGLLEAWGITDFISNMWGKIKSVTSAVWDGITSIFLKVKSSISGIISAVLDFIISRWNNLKNNTMTIFNAIFSVISSIWNKVSGTVKAVISNIWSNIVNTFNNIKSTVTNIFTNVVSTIKSKLENAKQIVSNIIDKIKGFFSGASLKFPNIKLPHLTVTGDWSFNPPKVPSFGIKWYQQGTDYAPGGLAYVGDGGAELVNLPRGSKVVPNRNITDYIGDAIKPLFDDFISKFKFVSPNEVVKSVTNNTNVNNEQKMDINFNPTFNIEKGSNVDEKKILEMMWEQFQEMFYNERFKAGLT